MHLAAVTNLCLHVTGMRTTYRKSSFAYAFIDGTEWGYGHVQIENTGGGSKEMPASFKFLIIYQTSNNE